MPRATATPYSPQPWQRGTGLLALTLLASLAPSPLPATAGPAAFASPRPSWLAPGSPLTATDSCWTGYLAGRIPIFVHYQRDGDVLVGEITYLNTQSKTPIRLLGTIEADHTYRLLEFDKAGTITGILTGRPEGRAFTGSWFSPTTRKELALQLVRKEARVAPAALRANGAQLFGSYFYRYGTAGPQGTFTLTKLAAGKAAFELVAVTDAPARNIAEVPRDTVSLTGSAFTYALLDAPNCAFRVRFYPGFVVVRYTKGDCAVQFGHNATAEGIFLKTTQP